jgi:[glutamine synthetase] adenylyltransferase / [glutamine synthetase]-adenylyl-L-tyrosine phosphorylase
MEEPIRKQDLASAIARARACSPFLNFLLDTQLEVAAALTAGDLDGAVAAARAVGEAGDVMTAVRRERSALALALGIGDLAGALSLEEVVQPLSDLADRQLERALAAAFTERTPEEPARGFAILALGKLGGRELNYSSDLDLVFLYDPETLPRRAREEAGQAALRIGQRVVEILQKRTEDGYAFRIDLRLRPSPEVTPIALPVEAAIAYYESAALPWERAAFVRARLAAGDRALGRDFLDAIHPFVWRRSLDFGAIGEISAISRRIRDHYAQGQAFGPGFDLKRGRGGIREIEFFLQIHQLIHGGREPELRPASTLAALSALARAGRIGADVAVALEGAYRLLRTIEHRLQMVDDRQTHSLPADPAALDNVARLHGLADGGALLELIAPVVARDAAIYDTLVQEDAVRLPEDPAGLDAALEAAGFSEPAPARARIEGWRGGKIRSLRTAAARSAFEAMLPVLIEALGVAPDPIAAMNRFEDLIMGLPSGVNFYRLLEARPGLTEHLATILSHAPALAGQLGRRPELLDGLIDASALEPVPSVTELAERFARADGAGEDFERVLDRVRRRVNETRFALGAQVVLGAGDPIEVSRGYARVAEAAIQVLADATIAEFEKVHGRVPEARLVILGLGRLGGGALTHASDLDLIYLFSGSYEGESDGPKPLRTSDYFNRLAPRISAALSVPTAAGRLYEVDTRLRPSGSDGLLAISLDTFAAYQRDKAWTFEHMALCRARPVYGTDADRAALQGIVDEVLCLPREPARVAEDAQRMRLEIARHKPAKGDFDIKLAPGGLVDLEFAVHTLQLSRRTALAPRLAVALAELIEAGLVPPELARHHALLARMLVVLRLIAPDGGAPAPASRELVARASGTGGWEELLAAHEAARQSIASLWQEVAESRGC